MAIDWAPGESRSSNDATRPVSRAAMGTLLRRMVLVVLIAIALIGGARLTMSAWTQPVSFDGAMNLEVARSLAEGHGYNRMYGDHGGFSHEIQTRAPYILPAAAVFATFGVGLWQAQFVNLLYVAAFVVLCFLLLRRWASWRWGLAAVAIVLATPGIEDIGLNGYGELPAATWWMGSLLVLYTPQHDRAVPWQRAFSAGVLIGIAIVTKTVLLIGFAATGVVFVYGQSRRSPHWRPVVAACAAFAFGACLPALAHEWARAHSLGGLAGWNGWFAEEWQSINMQAGTTTGFSDSATPVARILVHFGLLATSIGVPAWLLLAWIVASAGLLVAAIRKRTDAAISPVLLTLATFALIYFVWWLAITPTQKAWYRRIFDGVIALELLFVSAGAAVWRNRARPNGVAGVVQIVVAFVIVALQAAIVRSGLAADRWPTSAPSRILAENLAAVAALPSDALLYGIGWYSNPAIALYSGRTSEDLADAIPSQLRSGRPAFLLVDSKAHAMGVDRYWLQRYAHEVVAARDNLSVYRLLPNALHDPFEGVIVDPKTIGTYVNFIETDYPYAFGFQVREGEGWRWASASVDLLLRYQGEDTFLIDAYLVEPSTYRLGKRIGVTVWIGDCRLGTVVGALVGDVKWRLPLKTCALKNGDVEHIRLISDNVIDSRDDRQMSFIARGLGFVRSDAGAAKSD